MRDILMETFKLGLGAMDLTREQAARLVGKIERAYPGEIKDGRKMVDDLVKQGKENAKRFDRRVRQHVDRAIKEQQLVEERDLKELAANVRELARTTGRIGTQAGRNTIRLAKAATKRQPAKKAAKKSTKRKTAKKTTARRTATKKR